MERFNQEGEELPAFELKLQNGETLEATPENTELVMYLGNIGIYSHFTTRIQQDPPAYARIFHHMEGFNQARDFMMENGYPMYVNLRKVGDSIIKSFDSSIAREAKGIDSIPEDWA